MRSHLRDCKKAFVPHDVSSLTSIALLFIQPTWKAIKSAAVNLPGGNEVQLEDVQTMADLCPDVVILRDPQQYCPYLPLVPNKSSI